MKSRKIKFFSIAIASLAVVAAIAYLAITKIVIPNNKYKSAVALANDGKYAEAISAFEDMNGYKDSAEKAKEIYSQHIKDIIRDASVGDEVFFGTYEQDNDTSNGTEDIEWIILAKEDKRALVISKYALEKQPFNTSRTDVTWETCSLRGWLNGEFYNSAFDSEEKNIILDSTVTADKNPIYSTPPGNDVTDKVFLLSITEAEKYLNTVTLRCQGTAFCYAQNKVYVDVNGNCLWWLRSPGAKSDYVAFVNSHGEVSEGGDECIKEELLVCRVFYATRPALWINLES